MLFGNKPKRDDNVQKQQPKPTRKEQRMLRKQAKIEAKRQRKLDRKERSKVRKIGQWMKNLGKSSTDIFLDLERLALALVLVSASMAFSKL